jgi:LPPG:FO 2-phospho-L-lactate transferase
MAAGGTAGERAHLLAALEKPLGDAAAGVPERAGDKVGWHATILPRAACTLCAMRVVVLAGGFGGAKMAHGFALLDGVELAVVGNTADDFELHGLHISPDLDTLMYTLAGMANAQTGWGVAGETWSATEMLDRYGEPTWFALGDRDLATHIVRTAQLRGGRRLTEVTDGLRRRLGVAASLLPMTDDPVRTRVRTDDGWLEFQDYFVRRGHRDEVRELDFASAATARPTAEVLAAIGAAELIVIAPSNPFVSIGPLLALPGMTESLRAAAAPIVAVSPIVGGAALRGPAEQLLRSLADDCGAAGVARHYARLAPGVVDWFVLDESDATEVDAVRLTGLEPLVLPSVMLSEDDRRRLAEAIVTAVGTAR